MSEFDRYETLRPDFYEAYIEARAVFVDDAAPEIFPDFRAHVLDILRRFFVNGMLAGEVCVKMDSENEFVATFFRDTTPLFPAPGTKPEWLNREVLEQAFITNDFSRFTDAQLAGLVFHPWVILEVSADLEQTLGYYPEWTVEIEEQEFRLDPSFAAFTATGDALTDYVKTSQSDEYSDEEYQGEE